MPLNFSPAMLNVLRAGLIKTGWKIRNLTMTTALSSQRLFIDKADIAYMQVTTGAMSYGQAIRQAVKDAASQGLSTVDYESKRVDQLDVAMRRTVLTGIGQTTGQIQMARADDMKCDLVAVSAHVGARNKGTGPMNHESWQGGVYSRSGNNKKYGNFYEITGYGTGEGLCGWNCRHSCYPFYEGISKNAYTKAILDSYAKETVTYQGQEISRYEASQVQRGIERHIRDWKRQLEALDAAGLDNADEISKIKEWQARMREFVRETGLIRQNIREQI